MGQGGGGRFQETFDEKIYGHLNVKYVNVYSISVFFLEAALKRRPRATKAEINN